MRWTPPCGRTTVRRGDADRSTPLARAVPRRCSRPTGPPRRRLAGMLLALGATAGCSGGVPAAPAPQIAIEAQSVRTEAVPFGAIAVGPDLYQVPIGRDADGCLMYRLDSPTRMVALAISYRALDGGFTMDQRQALCDRQVRR